MSYAFWLKYLLERLGVLEARQLWEEAFANYDHDLLGEILSTGWVEGEADDSNDGASDRLQSLEEFWGDSDMGMSTSEAESLISATPPLAQLRNRYPGLSVQRDSTAYEALHLYSHGIALLAEALIDRYGKQGEFVAYDILSAGRSAMGQRMAGPASAFLAMIDEESEQPDIFSAGLDAETIRASSSEHVSRVTTCEWARYFRERHPAVGYLVACSTDEAFARGFNKSIRLQRTSTLMEGGSECDFRYYTVGANEADSEESGAT
jgi:hypothetical protein